MKMIPVEVLAVSFEGNSKARVSLKRLDGDPLVFLDGPDSAVSAGRLEGYQYVSLEVDHATARKWFVPSIGEQVLLRTEHASPATPAALVPKEEDK